MLLQKVGIPSFFLLHSILLCECITVFLIHSSTHGHLGCFQHLATLNRAAMNIGVHKFFWIGVSGFVGYIPSNGITGSKGSILLEAVSAGCTERGCFWVVRTQPVSSPQGTVKIGDNRHDHKVGSSVLSFLTPVIYVFFWGPVVSLPKGLSILFVFSKKQLWVSLIFSIVFLFSISLISALIFIFLLMLALFFLLLLLFFLF